MAEYDGRSYFQGYTKHYVKVLIPLDSTMIELESNRIIPVEITGFLAESMMLGKVLIEN